MNKEFKNLTLFKKWTLENFPFIEADFDAITNYELMCKIIEYINSMGDQFNDIVNNQEYINEWFNNLDVQDEIDTKLDSMVLSGELSSIINQEIFSDIQNKILQNTLNIDAQGEILETAVKENQTESITMNMLTQEVRTALTGGSTAVVGEDSISQANIQDGAITIFKLDDYLQSTKSISYGDPMDLGERYAGMVINNNGTLVLNTTDQNFANYQVELEKGKIYAFTGVNTYLSRGLILADSDNNVIYETTPVASNQVNLTSLIFRVNDEGLTAYMGIFKTLYDSSSYTQFFARYNAPLLREVEIFTNNYKKITPKLITKLIDYYLSFGHDSYNLPRVYSYSGTNVYIYEIVKGKKYNVVGYDWSAACGIYLLGLDNHIIYQSTDASVGNQYVTRNYNFTAEVDGYICLFERGNYTPTIKIVEDLIDNSGSSEYVERLGFRRWFTLGDSLTEVNFRASKNYVGYVAEELGITAINLGHSGSGYMHENSGIKFVNEISNIANYNYETDIITVMGSINDFSHIASDLGQLGDTTTSTLYGCMYNFFDTLFTANIGARVGIILPPPTNTYHSSKITYDTYNKALKDTAELFSIPVLDLSEKSNLKPWIADFQTEFFTADGTGNTGQTDQVHPNSKGHWLIHNEIKEFIKTL